MTPYTDEQLLAFALGTEPVPGLEPAAAQDPELGRRLGVARELASLLDELPLEEPPAALRRSVRELGRRPSRLAVWLAALWTPTQELRPALRGAAAAPAVYRAGPFELDLVRTAAGDLVGELIAVEEGVEQPAAGRVTLFGATVASGELTDDGGFHLPGVDPGSYRLVLDLEGRDELVIVSELVV